MANRAIDPVRGKLPKVPDIRAHHLTINSRPTRVEAEALVAFDNAYSKCIAKIDELAYRNAHPRLHAIALSARPKFKKILASLMLGEITFGEANRARQRIYEQMESLFQSEAAEINREAQQRQISLQAQQQAYYNNVGLMMLQKMNPHPPRPQPAVPSSTNCTQFGNQIRCSHW